jgi:hypothetical protein
MRFQALPDYLNNVFGRRLALSEIFHIQIEVFVVEIVHNLLAEDASEGLGVHDKTRLRIGFSPHSHPQVEIVPMEIPVAAGPKDLLVFFLRPLVHVEAVGGVEMHAAG